MFVFKTKYKQKIKFKRTLEIFKIIKIISNCFNLNKSPYYILLEYSYILIYT